MDAPSPGPTGPTPPHQSRDPLHESDASTARVHRPEITVLRDSTQSGVLLSAAIAVPSLPPPGAAAVASKGTEEKRSRYDGEATDSPAETTSLSDPLTSTPAFPGGVLAVATAPLTRTQAMQPVPGYPDAGTGWPGQPVSQRRVSVASQPAADLRRIATDACLAPTAAASIAPLAPPVQQLPLSLHCGGDMALTGQPVPPTAFAHGAPATTSAPQVPQPRPRPIIVDQVPTTPVYGTMLHAQNPWGIRATQAPTRDLVAAAGVAATPGTYAPPFGMPYSVMQTAVPPAGPGPGMHYGLWQQQQQQHQQQLLHAQHMQQLALQRHQQHQQQHQQQRMPQQRYIARGQWPGIGTGFSQVPHPPPATPAHAYAYAHVVHSRARPLAAEWRPSELAAAPHDATAFVAAAADTGVAGGHTQAFVRVPTMSHEPDRPVSAVVHPLETAAEVGVAAVAGESAWTCPRCSKQFRDAAERDRHMHAVHARTGRYPCPFCGDDLSSVSNMFRHVRRQHGVEAADQLKQDRAAARRKQDRGFGS